jgi:hypothetical protein
LNPRQGPAVLAENTSSQASHWRIIAFYEITHLQLISLLFLGRPPPCGRRQQPPSLPPQLAVFYMQTLLLRHGLLIVLLTQDRTRASNRRRRHQRHGTQLGRGVALRSKQCPTKQFAQYAIAYCRLNSLNQVCHRRCVSARQVLRPPRAPLSLQGKNVAQATLSLTICGPPNQRGCCSATTTNSKAALHWNTHTHDRNSKTPDGSTSTSLAETVAATNPCRHARGNNIRSHSMRTRGSSQICSPLWQKPHPHGGIHPLSSLTVVATR